MNTQDSAPDALIERLRKPIFKRKWYRLALAPAEPARQRRRRPRRSPISTSRGTEEKDLAQSMVCNLLNDYSKQAERIAELSAAEANYQHFKSECAKRDERIAALEALLKRTQQWHSDESENFKFWSNEIGKALKETP